MFSSISITTCSLRFVIIIKSLSVLLLRKKKNSIVIIITIRETKATTIAFFLLFREIKERDREAKINKKQKNWKKFIKM